MKRTGVDVMKKLEQLYEGKAKKVFATEDPDVVIVDYKDDATAFNGEKKGTIVGKGVINNRMTNYVFQVLEKEGVPTHYVEELSDRETAVKKVEIVPLEVIVRNVAAGSFSKRLGIEEGRKLLAPTITEILFLQMRFHRIHAVFGIKKHMKNLTKTVSAEIWEM